MRDGYRKGGIVGLNYNGTIEYSCNTADILFNSDAVGGVVGDNYGTVKYCYNTGKLSLNYYRIGGISGCNKGNIEYCYNIGDVSALEGNSGQNTFAYGIGSGGNINNCYNVGKIYSKRSKAYPIGGMDAKIYKCYYLGNDTDNESEKTSDFMKSEEFLNMLNEENNIFIMDTEHINNGYPILNWQDEE